MKARANHDCTRRGREGALSRAAVRRLGSGDAPEANGKRQTRSKRLGGLLEAGDRPERARHASVSSIAHEAVQGMGGKEAGAGAAHLAAEVSTPPAGRGAVPRSARWIFIKRRCHIFRRPPF